MANYKIQVSNFSVFKPKITGRKMLRFDFTWKLEMENPNPEIGTKLNLGMTLAGCMAYVSTINGELYWYPPFTRKGKLRFTNIISSPDMYELIREQLLKSKYYAEIAPPKKDIWVYAEELRAD